MVTRGRQVQLTIAVHISMVARMEDASLSPIHTSSRMLPWACLEHLLLLRFQLTSDCPASEGYDVIVSQRSLRDYRVIAKVLLLREVGVSGSLLLSGSTTADASRHAGQGSARGGSSSRSTCYDLCGQSRIQQKVIP